MNLEELKEKAKQLNAELVQRPSDEGIKKELKRVESMMKIVARSFDEKIEEKTEENEENLQEKLEKLRAIKIKLEEQFKNTKRIELKQNIQEIEEEIQTIEQELNPDVIKKYFSSVLNKEVIYNRTKKIAMIDNVALTESDFEHTKTKEALEIIIELKKIGGRHLDIPPQPIPKQAISWRQQ